MSEPIKNRYEFVVFFDVENGNPNGDPDAGNMPRVDPETGYGLVTDVCLKRKIRNYVEMAKEGEPGYRIYIKDGVPLNTSDKEACAYVGVEADKLKEAKKKDEKLDIKLRDFMCSNFYDIRTFGAVMTTFVKGALNWRSGPGTGAAWLCPQRGPRSAAGDHHYPRGHHHRGGRGEQGHGNGAEIHCPLRPLPGGGLCLRQSCPQDHRLLGRRSEAAVGGHFEYV